MRYALAAILAEILDGAEDRKAAADLLLRRALGAAEALRMDGATTHDASVMRNAVRERLATLVRKDAEPHRHNWWPSGMAL
jgi:hypothetical protein